MPLAPLWKLNPYPVNDLFTVYSSIDSIENVNYFQKVVRVALNSSITDEFSRSCWVLVNECPDDEALKGASHAVTELLEAYALNLMVSDTHFEDTTGWFPPEPAPKKSKIAKFKASCPSSKLGAVTIKINRATGIVSVRRSHKRKSYELDLGAVAEMIIWGVEKADARAKKKAKKEARRSRA